eukprot:TRINITY_DN3419_c0_g2_i1.p1 TRINITY_DN3419_c0_g2~~TRINITY_DN3419_c0_g2_i1.p1  ORF type:complete len:750 (-),score=208.68 TRINITY_DN3419_c0_g2_i1:501-2750(-)
MDGRSAPTRPQLPLRRPSLLLPSVNTPQDRVTGGNVLDMRRHSVSNDEVTRQGSPIFSGFRRLDYSPKSSMVRSSSSPGTRRNSIMKSAPGSPTRGKSSLGVPGLDFVVEGRSLADSAPCTSPKRLLLRERPMSPSSPDRPRSPDLDSEGSVDASSRFSPSPMSSPMSSRSCSIEPLQHHNLGETDAALDFDHIASMACKMFGVPTCVISLLDQSRQWFKSINGLSTDEIGLYETFSAQASLHQEMLVVPDTLADPDFAHNPHVSAAPFIRFYAGAPLQCADGGSLGTLAIMDQKPHHLSDDHLSCLQELARMVIRELEQVLMSQLMLGISRSSQVLMDSTLDTQKAVESVLQIVLSTLGVRALELLVRKTDGGAELFVGGFSLGAEAEGREQRTSLSRMHVAAVSRAQAPAFFNALGAPVVAREGINLIRAAAVGVPVRLSDTELYGVIFLHSSAERPYTPSDVDFLMSVVWSLASYLRRRKAEQNSEELLVNILPDQIVQQLKTNRKSVAKRIMNATILFADFVGFTSLSGRMEPDQVVATLYSVFSVFDSLTEKWNVEKVKTIGDAYMVCAGVTVPNPHHAECCVELALDMIAATRQFEWPEPPVFRIGINSGPVVAGVLNLKRLAFDVFGDTVNVASRMEAACEPGCVRVTAATWEELDARKYLWEKQVVPVKGKGMIDTVLIRGRAVPAPALPAEYSPKMLSLLSPVASTPRDPIGPSRDGASPTIGPSQWSEKNPSLYNSLSF